MEKNRARRLPSSYQNQASCLDLCHTTDIICKNNSSLQSRALPVFNFPPPELKNPNLLPPLFDAKQELETKFLDLYSDDESLFPKGTFHWTFGGTWPDLEGQRTSFWSFTPTHHLYFKWNFPSQ